MKTPNPATSQNSSSRLFGLVFGSCRQSWAAAIGVLIWLIASPSVEAQPPQSITGAIDFTGGAVLNGSLGTATAYTSFFGPGLPSPTILSGSQTGDYQTVPVGTEVTITPFSFYPYNPSSDLSIPLWSFSVGTTNYSFVATSISEVDQFSNYLNVEGTGIASISGFANAPGIWSFTDTGFGSGPAFNFGASMAVLPEPSATALVMGVALVAYAFLPGLRRKSRH